MSHEIRTPMNAVIGLTSILSMSQPLTVKQKELVSTLKISADSLLDLINDMLDIAKIEANLVVLEYIPFNLRYAAEEVMNIMSLKAAEKKLRFTMDDSGLHHRDFIGDPTRIKQIFMNLCSNAIKFTPTGEVSIILKSSAQLSGIDDVTIIIKDTGIGIAKDKMESIFGKFVQGDATIKRRYGGTGLGLTITKNLTEIMGGSIAVDSQIEKGTTFTVTLPLKRSIASSMQPPNSRQDNIAKASHGTMKALLVEDNQANILVATSFLEHFGFKYDVALNGIDAVKKWESGSYFIILMDIQMPGQNGFEATRSIREHEKRLGKKRTPIIGMTAHVLAGDRDLCIECGMDDYISKPIDPEHLETKIRNIYNDASGAFSSNRSSSKANQAH
jgi:CheY-like chemotaxis protein